MAKDSAELDRRSVRRNFERAAATYAEASGLEAEVGKRMLERLDLVKIEPRYVLDAGSGPAREVRALAARYRGATILALDFSLAMLRMAREVSRKGLIARVLSKRSAAQVICGDLERLPLVGGQIGLLWSNMALHWAVDPLAVLREFQRVLGPEGLLMFSTLGPDTLRELRTAADPDRVHRFTDMHDLGDMLIATGFSAPVMDMELLTLRYKAPEKLLDDLRKSGQTLARRDRSRGLAGKRFGERLLAALSAQTGGAGLDVSFEVVYGHAWNGQARRAADGRAVVRTNFRRA